MGSLERLRERYGTPVTVQMPLEPPYVLLSRPEAIKQVLTAPPDVLHPGEGTQVLRPIVGPNSVILLDEDRHLEQRKLLLPCFHGERIHGLVNAMSEIVAREIETWPTEKPIELHPRLQHLTLEVILQTVFGVTPGGGFDRLSALVTELLGFGDSPISMHPAAQRVTRRFGPMRRLMRCLDQIDGLIVELVRQRVETALAGADDSRDVLAALLASRHSDGSPMSMSEVRDELMTALFAGYTTTAAQLAWSFERIARTPDVQAGLQTELDAGSGDAYMTATVQEILRMRPPLPNLEPRITKRAIEIDGFTYPAGIVLLISAYLVHHDPAIYPEPEVFRPERFIATPPGTYTWLPFGGGRRRCLGASFAMQEIKLVLRAVLDRYEVVPCTHQSEPVRRRSVAFIPANGARVVLRPRDAGHRLPNAGARAFQRVGAANH